VIAHLAFGEQQHKWLALAIDDGVQFGVQAAFRAADTAGKSPFLSRRECGPVRFEMRAVDPRGRNRSIGSTREG
jgi:hypothetical protein